MVTERDMTLLTDWRGNDIAGWLLTEKLDGVRAMWDGAAFWTRSGRRIEAPEWFTAGLPSCRLDGEIHAGRGGFVAARNAVNHGHWTDAVRFAIFDVPDAAGTWEQRMAVAPATRFAEPVERRVCERWEDALNMMVAIHDAGGEGVVARHPTATGYEHGRSRNAVRVK